MTADLSRLSVRAKSFDTPRIARHRGAGRGTRSGTRTTAHDTRKHLVLVHRNRGEVTAVSKSDIDEYSDKLSNLSLPSYITIVIYTRVRVSERDGALSSALLFARMNIELVWHAESEMTRLETQIFVTFSRRGGRGS